MADQYKFAYKTAHDFLKKFITSGDLVIDATCGNGNDTLFLSNIVGAEGKVLAIDIDEKAIENTKELIQQKSNFPNNILYSLNSHDNLSEILEENNLKSPKAILFNLGYLPGSDKAVKTKPETTLKALKAAVNHLDSPGIVTVVFYPHESGLEEWAECKEYLKHLTGDLNSYIFKRLNRKNPPFLVIIIKD